MSGGFANRHWPFGLMVMAAAVVTLALGYGGRLIASDSSLYPLRITLADPVDPTPPASPQPVAAIAPEPTEASLEQPPHADFAAAFAGMGGDVARAALPARAPAAALVAKPVDGLLAVRFDLANPFAPGATDSGPIQLIKAVKVNGFDAGSATIRVTDGPTIAIAAGDLGHLLADAGRGDLAGSLGGSGFVSFDRIRKAGLEVRYDAASDRILLSS